LGDSYVLGYGVHAADNPPAFLQRNLDEHFAASSHRYEVFNFGSIGFCTRQERGCYEDRAAKYHPQIVVLVMIENDTISMQEEQELGSHFLWNKMQEAPWLVRENYRRRMAEITALREQYEKCLPEVRALHERCRENGAKLLVVIYRNHD